MQQTKSIYGLNYDYIDKGEHFIVFYKDEHITSDDLTALQSQMLQSNHIPSLLPFEKHEMNNAIKLLYRYTHKRMLIHELRINPLSIVDYYNILLNIIMILEHSKTYMLSEEHYILHEQFIFFENDITNVYLCYLPLKTLDDKESVQEGMERIALHLISFVREIKGQGFQQFIKTVRDPTCTLQQLKTTLTLLVANHATGSAEEAPIPSSGEVGEVGVIAEADSELKPSTKSAGQITSEKKRMHLLLNKRGLNYIIAVVLSGMIALFYFKYPVEGMLYICLGLIVLVGDAVYVAGSLVKPATPEHVLNRVSYHDANSIGYDIVPEQYYNELVNHTTILNRSDATVFLKPHRYTIGPLQSADEEECSVIADSMNVITQTEAYLQLNVDGKFKHIDIDKSPFVIGRERFTAEQIDFAGVSRLHCDIVQTEDGWAIKDLGSSNGSLLNEEKLVPYKLKQLQDGDEIAIVRNKFIFRIY